MGGMTDHANMPANQAPQPGLVPSEPEPSLRRRIVTHVLFGVVVVAIVAIWILTPLRQWLDVSSTVDTLRGLDQLRWMPVLLMLVFIIGGLLVFPVNVLTAASIIIFGNVLGVVYALIGATLSAIVVYEIGHYGGRHLLRRVPGSRLDRLSVKLARHGVVAVVVLRIVPVAPYSIINLMAGASRISRRDYILGTVLGMTPGTILAALLIDRVLAAIDHPHLANFVWLAVAIVIFAAASVWLGRRILRASHEQT